MPDAWRAYLEMALGLTEAPRKRAQQVVGELANRGGATAAQLQGLVDDLMSAGVANREALTNIVRHEVDRALGVVGLATAEEVDELTTRVRGLERELRQARASAAGTDTGAGTRVEQPAPLPRKVAKKAVAEKAVKATPNAMPSAGTKPAMPAANTVRAESPATPAPTKKAVAKKAVAPEKAAPAPTGAAPKAAPAKAGPVQAGPVKKALAKKAAAKALPAPAEISVPAGTAEAPTAAVKAAAAATELPPVGTTDAVFGSPTDDAGAVDSGEAGLVDQGEAGLTPVAGPAKKAAARKTAAKRAGAPKAAPATATPADMPPAKTTRPARTAAKKAAPPSTEGQS